MRLNIFPHRRPRTNEGAPANANLTVEQQLRRAVLSCLLWEDQFYESGMTIADRITGLAHKAEPSVVAALAVEARHKMHLRHVPLLLLSVLCRTGRGSSLVSDTIEAVITRPDELCELVAIHNRDGREKLPAQMKKGLARAFVKFDAYQLAKYNRKGPVTLRTVMFLTHPKPRDTEQEEVFRKLADGVLESPDTWEVALSGGADKAETFTRLLTERRLGYLALLRNLRGMIEAGVDPDLVSEAVVARRGAGRVLPFRYVAAARACPMLEPELDTALTAAIADMPELSGRTVVLVDVSGSMGCRVSGRSELTRMDAAAALAAIIPGKRRVFSFSCDVKEVPPRTGMAGIEAVINSQPHGGTMLGKAVEHVNRNVPHDRLIVITDEQSHDRVPPPVASKAYMINVASYRNGIGYGDWTKIDGFSEAVLRFIHELEADEADRIER